MRKRRRYVSNTLQQPKAPRWWRWLRGLLIAATCVIVLGVGVGVIVGMSAYKTLTEGLPQLDELENYDSSLVTRVYDRHGELIADFFIEKRLLIDLAEVPLFIRQATIAVEDARFYSHGGFDTRGILRAMWVNFRAGEVREGASTITQQVARTLFLNRERTMRRKLREIILAARIERRFSKDEILRMYLNQVFYGHNAYGVEAAAQIYFGKATKALTLGEGLLIVGLTQSPNAYSPLKDLPRSLQRRQYVLRRMVEQGHLDANQAQQVAQEPVELNPNYKQVNKSPYFVEYVRQYLETHYGSRRLYRGGFEVHTTLDLHLQQVAEQAVRRGVREVDQRHGYQGPLRRVDLSRDAERNRQVIESVAIPPDGDRTIREGERLTGVVLNVGEKAVWVAVKDSRGVMTPKDSFAWVREPDLKRGFDRRARREPREIFQRGDVIRVRAVRVDARGQAHILALEQDPVVQSALMTIEAGSGHVLAMVGGYDFAISQFNRATQAIRQPGSAFKPIIYTAALEAGKTPASIVYDRAVVKRDADTQQVWKPKNYSHKYYGAQTLRTALTHSRNMVTIRLMEDIGVPAVLASARRLGIESPLAPYLSLALGSSGVSLLELTASYSTFANGGLYIPPIFITRIEDADGQVIEEHLPQAQRALSPEIAYIMTSMLQGVIENGTGRRVRALKRPAAGKTGTTNDFRDAWFIGFTPEIITGVWVGIDDHTMLGQHENGGRAAAPIWLEFMQEAVRGHPITDFPIPFQVRFYRIDAQSGRQATASTQTDTLFEAFVQGSQPQIEVPSRNLRQKIRRLDRRSRSAARTMDRPGRER